MREFVADASHELRTPLSIIRGEADVALSQDRDATEYRDALAIIQDEAKRLSRIVDDMLALARADAGRWRADVESRHCAGWSSLHQRRDGGGAASFFSSLLCLLLQFAAE
jgi:signal transduction histidine kinase